MMHELLSFLAHFITILMIPACIISAFWSGNNLNYVLKNEKTTAKDLNVKVIALFIITTCYLIAKWTM